MTIQIVCTPRALPQHLRVAAAERAVAHNPANRPSSAIVARALGPNPPREHIALLTAKRWHTNGVKLTVGFLDNPPIAAQAHHFAHERVGEDGECAIHRDQDEPASAHRPRQQPPRHGGLLVV